MDFKNYELTDEEAIKKYREMNNNDLVYVPDAENLQKHFVMMHRSNVQEDHYKRLMAVAWSAFLMKSIDDIHINIKDISFENNKEEKKEKKEELTKDEKLHIRNQDFKSLCSNAKKISNEVRTYENIYKQLENMKTMINECGDKKELEIMQLAKTNIEHKLMKQKMVILIGSINNGYDGINIAGPIRDEAILIPEAHYLTMYEHLRDKGQFTYDRKVYDPKDVRIMFRNIMLKQLGWNPLIHCKEYRETFHNRFKKIDKIDLEKVYIFAKTEEDKKILDIIKINNKYLNPLKLILYGGDYYNAIVKTFINIDKKVMADLKRAIKFNIRVKGNPLLNASGYNATKLFLTDKDYRSIIIYLINTEGARERFGNYLKGFSKHIYPIVFTSPPDKTLRHFDAFVNNSYEELLSAKDLIYNDVSNLSDIITVYGIIGPTENEEEAKEIWKDFVSDPSNKIKVPLKLIQCGIPVVTTMVGENRDPNRIDYQGKNADIIKNIIKESVEHNKKGEEIYKKIIEERESRDIELHGKQSKKLNTYKGLRGNGGSLINNRKRAALNLVGGNREDADCLMELEKLDNERKKIEARREITDEDRERLKVIKEEIEANKENLHVKDKDYIFTMFVNNDKKEKMEKMILQGNKHNTKLQKLNESITSSFEDLYDEKKIEAVSSNTESSKKIIKKNKSPQSKNVPNKKSHAKKKKKSKKSKKGRRTVL